MKISEEKIKKIAGAASLSALIIALLFEISRKIFPGMTNRPTALDYTLSVFRNAFLIILALAFTVFLFLLLKKRLGIIKAVFYTIYSDSLIGFFVGAVMMTLASMQNISAIGLTALESIYYYFLGIFIMVISAAIFVIGMIAFAVLRFISGLKEKKHQAIK
ncbi:MAG: hypothetical protein IJZ89_04075 [Clostridia bacterium]|nr:hypothetical protein [Clostridia bacterium]